MNRRKFLSTDAITTVVALELDGPPRVDPPVIAQAEGNPLVLDHLAAVTSGKTVKRFNRRDFLKTTSLTGLALAARSLNALGVNDDLRLAVIGLGGKGGQHVERFSQAPGVRVTALGEPDPKRLAAHAERLKQRGTTAFAATDPRRVLDRADVDAVVIATPTTGTRS